ncbi:MAG: hypothetical protein ACRENP_21060 [Longimicrobiales bacterium]
MATLYAGLNKQELQAAIASADSAETLDEIWGQLAPLGYSMEGQMHASILARRAELGAALSEVETALIKQAAERAAHGASLPPITGKRGD